MDRLGARRPLEELALARNSPPPHPHKKKQVRGPGNSSVGDMLL